ncbi:N-carbamyl-L-amino acid amidohydrolase [Pseudidiomarina salinarum]|uniref:Negative modulator of initiation of replication n=1 Tax=Pseudidiomarina salinarum TaxID=435908 RepID=A0A094LAY0_9GAMM|nr:N-carbamoyl-L-amino acid amidohydrolase [Pseudidiomarina salinarum]KFZ32038.1 N-carbamyl-L-amino acid amidohydrolase [Pseudidiomarina salinarum]RUO70182.1 replication initiation regulator SeqA [Pseudidiomarina salinarum]
MSKRIEIDDELYRFIAGHTQHIGESASSILRRLLDLETVDAPPAEASRATASGRERSRRSIFDSMTRADLAGQRSAVARFLYILGMLYRCHSDEFAAVLKISGRDRQYFAVSAAELEAHGSSTNPKQIPGSPYFVVTNNNTTRKKSMLTQVAEELGYTPPEAEQIRDFL